MSFITMNLVTMMYLIASVCFIQALKGLSSPATARKGNAFGMAGMAIAAATTIALILRLKADIAAASEGAEAVAAAARALGMDVQARSGSGGLGLGLVALGVVVGGGIGAFLAKRVEMTKMPELVAAMHSLIGMAAVCIAIAAVAEPHAFGIAARGQALPVGNRIELFIGTFVGAITFSGSVIAFGKLAGKYKFRLFQGAPVVFSGQHMLNLVLALVMVGLGLVFVFSGGSEPAWTPFLIMTAIAFVLGVLIIIPIGGADMPVVVSMLNSYSGWAAAGIGFSLNNSMLIIAGSLVGSSGAILSYIMCKAMNRSFFNVILGGFGGDTSAATAGGAQAQRNVKSGSSDDAVFLMQNAETVIIVPGYGLAVARAQHALKELVEKLGHHGVTVKYAIHPVAGRMPGHMNVLLAEAEVPYDQVFEMEDINSEFAQADVVLVLGANDVVNPAAKDPKSPIAGMPILEAYKAKTIIVNKRSMASGYAGLDNELFYMDKTMMVFGDAKKVLEDMVKAVE
ncbi:MULTISPECIES: NAD(P)(+) transhydrogenase (Re/Si-specific) subunit beta [unclassified Duganella]|uniref:NAD(P)(+) transhydrogenase (Re/Si-specific) subunit beta n=1 Tax=unclassified Duganella TaxID=2636909 RepID=UPI0007020701|nr:MULTISPECIES: NAD(P)(+) transhydrogenase (Re/Si-specific) subunit beta [unclassified Duganella]KQV47730.1 NAD synthetase [Duganella sp. Root336D2]KRB81982.1 NAD synthetase [Duganella sp. Root198D2]